MFFHIFGHIEADQLHTQTIGQLFGHFGFANTSRTRKEIVADWLFRFAQAGSGKFDCRSHGLDGRILAKDYPFQTCFKIPEHFGVVFRHGFRRNACDFCNHSLNLFHANGFAPLAIAQQMLGSTGFVNHVNCFIGQFTVVDVAGRQFNRDFNCIGSIFHVMMLFKIRL